MAKDHEYSTHTFTGLPKKGPGRPKGSKNKPKVVGLENENDWNGTSKPHRLLPFDKYGREIVEASESIPSKITVPSAIRQRVARAIVLIHNQARYWEGMAILSGIAGWKPRVLENEFDSYTEQKVTRDEFNAWVKKMSG